MVDEQQPAKKVVKRVVKKTVVRPPAEAPTVRYGRPAPATKPRAKVATRPTPKASGATTTRPRPRVEVGAKVGAAGKTLSSRGAGAASRAATAARSAARATSTFTVGRLDALRAWRIPHIAPGLASVVTGALVGLVAVGLGLAALELFTSVRGVASGGGRWGTLTFVVVAFIAILLGDVLLRAFGTAHAGVISFLGVTLAIVAILGLFLDVADSQWALVLVPVLGMTTYFLAHWLMTIAESAPTLPE